MGLSVYLNILRYIIISPYFKYPEEPCEIFMVSVARISYHRQSIVELEVKLRPLGMPCTIYTVMITNDISAGRYDIL